MFKKLLTLAAVAALCGNVQAKVVEDAYVDWTTTGWSKYIMGYIPTTNADEGLVFEWPDFDYKPVADLGEGKDYEIVSINGEDNYIVPCEDGALRDDWGIQAFFMNVPTELGTAYSMTVYAKANHPVNMGANMQWGWGDGNNVPGQTLSIGTDWEEITVDWDEVGGSSCDIILQLYSGDKGEVGDPTKVCIKWSKVFHEEKEGGRPVEWEDWLVNGDAEGEYGDVPCAYSKTYVGRDAANGNAEIGEPLPSPIEMVDGSNVFVCQHNAVDPTAYPDFFMDGDNVKGDVEWQNQFWIQSPKAWNTGETFKVSFRYKASKNTGAVATQAHGQTPGGYLHWAMIGDITFTTDWQYFEKEVTVDGSQNGMWSIAFNLGANGNYKEDITFYFDDMKWETMKLDEGWFVAGDFNDNNLDEAVELEFDDEEELYIGTVGDATSPAQVIMISTKRGNDKAFKANTIRAIAPEGGDLFDDEFFDDCENTWYNFSPKTNNKINLPQAGVWTITIDAESGEINFTCPDLSDSGIEGVSVENAPAVYYNLQGVQVNNPANGIFIVKQGNKVTKRVIR